METIPQELLKNPILKLPQVFQTFPLCGRLPSVHQGAQFQMEIEVRERRREMDSKLHELTAEKGELKKSIEMSAQSSLKEQVRLEKSLICHLV